MLRYIDYERVYTVAKRLFVFVPTLVAPFTLIYDAPFGRFSTPDSLFAIDGIKAWIVMELPSPASFLTTLAIHPFSRNSFPLPPAFAPQTLLAALYLIHYLNRAIISPLRTPSRAPSHLLVVLASYCFNIPNGFLLASYLSASSTSIYLQNAFASPRFWLGVTMWALGFVGNVVHDEILLDIRRKAKAKGKGREVTDGKKSPSVGEHYAIPQGLLYQYISYPNYFCEWIEWLGFAIAASPSPDLRLLPSVATFFAAITSRSFGDAAALLLPVADFFSPPWAFFTSEVLLMLPRAVRGHQWYLRRFGEAYPRERRVIIPWLL
ncbi:3-oxo-5-alpha-steroid 4-dehydrogenase-domain-containing protein [Amylostereum chailletii]|nr:3-oxo-5-alpha-steroid 4-dehydrogenase-domain-containing protein [Amylostereum chailletii]